MANILRHVQALFNKDSDGDITVEHYKNTITSATGSTNLPSVDSMDDPNRNLRHLITSTNIVGRDHKLKFIVDNCSTNPPKLIGTMLRYRHKWDDRTDADDLTITTTVDQLKISNTEFLIYAAGDNQILTSISRYNW